MALKLLGYWKNSLDDEYPCPQELEGELKPDARTRLIRYLRTPPVAPGPRVLRMQCGMSWCRYGCERANGSMELSDGEWIWPEGLSHYVHEHSLALLPHDFLERVMAYDEARARSVSLVLDTSPSTDDDKIDEASWIAWGRQHRTSEFQSSLEELRGRAQATARSALDADVDKLSRALGVTATECATLGCRGYALRNRTACGHCYLQEMAGPSRLGHAELRSFLSSCRSRHVKRDA